MKKNTKIMLAVLGALLLLGCLVCAGFLALTGYAAAAAADPAFLKEAEAFGKKSAQQDCENHALDIARGCSDIDIGCRTRAQTFSTICLQHAKPTPKFCERLGLDPNGDALSQGLKGGMWSAMRCNKIANGSQACTSALNGTVNFCTQKTNNQGLSSKPGAG